VYELVKKFHIKAGCIINKSDLNSDKTNEIMEFLKDENIVHLANLPYDENFTKAMTDCKTVVELNDNKLKDILTQTWNKIKELNK
jgi:MinD superfamily P-loop ATPase